MPTSWTYATLKQAVKDHVEDHGTAFDGVIDNLIKLGEDRIVKDLPLTIFDARDQDVTITAGTQTATKPTDAIATRELYYVDDNSTRVVLLPRSYSWIRAAYPDTTQRTPKYFAEDYSETQYFIGPNPNVSKTAKADVTKRPASIVSASTTWIGTNAGDLLLASCMVAAERFNLGWAESKDWKADYDELVTAARIDFRHILRRDYATLAPQPQAAGKGER